MQVDTGKKERRDAELAETEQRKENTFKLL
jgi:hypothetical protein